MKIHLLRGEKCPGIEYHRLFETVRESTIGTSGTTFAFLQGLSRVALDGNRRENSENTPIRHDRLFLEFENRPSSQKSKKNSINT